MLSLHCRFLNRTRLNKAVSGVEACGLTRHDSQTRKPGPPMGLNFCRSRAPVLNAANQSVSKEMLPTSPPAMASLTLKSSDVKGTSCLRKLEHSDDPTNLFAHVNSIVMKLQRLTPHRSVHVICVALNDAEHLLRNRGVFIVLYRTSRMMLAIVLGHGHSHCFQNSIFFQPRHD